jgi:hypothetical protein
MPSGYGLTEATSFEVVSAYASARTRIQAVAASPGWHVAGAFFLPLSGSARLDVLGSVSAAGLTMNVRLFDLVTNQPVPGLVSITSLGTTRQLGPLSQLTGQRAYQIQAEVIGGTTTDKFGTLDTATVSE